MNFLPSDIGFENSAYLWGCLFSIFVFLGIFAERKFHRHLRNANSPKFGYGKWSRFLFTLLVAISATATSVMFFISSARPYLSETIIVPVTRGSDFCFVLDTSLSMLAEDLYPNRIEQAKKTIASFVTKRKNDRFCLIVFTGKPFLISPMTSDHETFAKILSAVSTDTIRQELPGFAWTAIGDALLLSSTTFPSDGKGDRNVILMTDGEANVGIDPYKVIPYLKSKDLRVHSIGIGSTEGIELTFTDQKTGMKRTFVNEKGEPVISKIDVELLTTISKSTSGIYSDAASAEDLAKSFDRLDGSVSSDTKYESRAVKHDLTYRFLLLAAVFFLPFLLWRKRTSDDSFV